MEASATLRKIYRGARSRRQARELKRFTPSLRHDPAAPALLLSPHWDDAVLDCWGLLSEGGPLEVLNLFAGTPAPGTVTLWDSITGSGDSAARTRERLAEDALALGRAGRTPQNLPLLDAQYRSGESVKLSDLDGAVSARVPAASHLYAPAGIGSHPDHVLARQYARALLRVGMPVTLYAELPYCVLHGWPQWVDGREREPNRDVDVFWLSYLDGVAELPPLREADVWRLDDEQASEKLEAMRSYTTQLPALGYGARGLLEDPEIHRYEVSWRLRAG
jgi:LmbE family N-acetylglucosaminyl deacetylase